MASFFYLPLLFGFFFGCCTSSLRLVVATQIQLQLQLLLMLV